MVKYQENQVILRTDVCVIFSGDRSPLEYHHPPCRTLFQIKGAVYFFCQGFVQLRRTPSKRIFTLEGNLDGRMYALNGFAMLRSKESAQHRMALSQPSESASQRLQIGISMNGDRAGKVRGNSLRR
jgi:hypothetical protein